MTPIERLTKLAAEFRAKGEEGKIRKGRWTEYINERWEDRGITWHKAALEVEQVIKEIERGDD